MTALRVCVYTFGLAVAAGPVFGQFPLNQRPSRGFGQLQLEPRTLAVNLVEGREFNQPQGVAIDSSVSPPVLYVSDTVNHRVLGWRNALTFANGAQADFVIGQRDLSRTNPGGPPSAPSDLTFPGGIVVDKRGSLYVVDAGNNRIVRYKKPYEQPFGEVLFDMLLGQRSASGREANVNGRSAATIATSVNNQTVVYGGSLAFDATGNLWFADTLNNRVLRWPAGILGDDVPNGQPADLVFGQDDFVSADLGTGDQKNKARLRLPRGISVDTNGNVFVADERFRVLVYTLPYGIGKDATRVLGVQGNVASCPGTQTVGEITMNPDSVMLLNGNEPVIVDNGLNRLSLYDRVEQWPTETDLQFSPRAKAQSVPAGQLDFCGYAANRGLVEPNGSTFYRPTHGVQHGTELFLVDGGNNRLLVFDVAGFGSTSTAKRVLGQEDFYPNAINSVDGRELRLTSGGAANSGIVVDNRAETPYLYVADTYNNRVLGFRDARKIRPGARADIVIGQPGLQRAVINWPNGDPDRPSNQGLFGPSGVTLDSDGNLYVADTGNGRVLRFPKPFSQPAGALHVANLVLGQSGFNNKDSTPTARTMSNPVGVAFASNNGLLVSDAAHNRVLFFRGAAAAFTNGQTAAKVFGQPDFNTILPGASDNQMRTPFHISTDTDDRLYVADSGNNRVLIFNSAPVIEVNPRAAVVLQLATGNSFLSNPRGIWVSSNTGEIWVTELGLSRALRYPKFNDLTPTPTSNNPAIAFPFNYGAAAVTQDAFGNVYFADTANRVSVHYASLAALNAANFVVGRAVSPGTIASLFRQGRLFTNVTASAPVVPLPKVLGDVQVTVNGTQTALYFVSPDQINFLVPMNAPTSGRAEVEITQVSTGAVLAADQIEMSEVSPALFTRNQNGIGAIAALNEDNTVNGPDNPIARGKVLQLFGTGQGVVPNAPPEGSVGPSNPPIETTTKPDIAIGGDFLGTEVVQFSGLAPGLVGVWQINVKVPDTVLPQAQGSIIVIRLKSVLNVGTGQRTLVYVKQ